MEPASRYTVSLRTALFVPVLLPALVCAFLIADLGVQSYRQELGRTERDTQALTRRFTADFDDLTLAIRELGHTLSLLPEVEKRDAAAVEPVLRKLLKRNPVYANLSLTDRDGRVWASALPAPGGQVSLADRKYFTEAMATGRFSAGEYTRGKWTGRPVLGFGYPVPDANGRPAGCVAVAVDLSYFERTRASTALPPGAVLVLADHRGTVLSRFPAARGYVGTTLPPETLAAMKAEPAAGTDVAPGLDGVRRVRTYASLRLSEAETPYLYIRVGLPYQPILDAIRRGVARNSTVLAAAVLPLFLLSWYVGRRLVSAPVAALKAALDRVGEGDLSPSLRPPLRTTELEEVGRALDHMVAHLAESLDERGRAERALRESETRMGVVYRTSLVAIGLNHLESGRFLDVNGAFCTLFGYTRDEVVGHTAAELGFLTSPGARSVLIEELIAGRRVDGLELQVRLRSGALCTLAASAERVDLGSERCYLVVASDVTRRKQAEGERDALLERARHDAATKERLLHEVNHRVKNNLIALLGLLLAERRGAPPEGLPWIVGTVERLTSRVQGLIAVHDMLSAFEWAPLPLNDLARRVVGKVLAHAAGADRLWLDVAPSETFVAPRQANSLALVLNELATNTLKHAAPSREQLRVGVRTAADGDFLVLEYRDNGPGYPADVLGGALPSVGLGLVTSLAEGTLRGTLTLTNDGGAVATLRWRQEELVAT